jgi:flagellar biosynthesis GTPase FlhF
MDNKLLTKIIQFGNGNNFVRNIRRILLINKNLHSTTETKNLNAGYRKDDYKFIKRDGVIQFIKYKNPKEKKVEYMDEEQQKLEEQKMEDEELEEAINNEEEEKRDREEKINALINSIKQKENNKNNNNNNNKLLREQQNIDSRKIQDTEQVYINGVRTEDIPIDEKMNDMHECVMWSFKSKKFMEFAKD